jgi:hypothetical protein
MRFLLDMQESHGAGWMRSLVIAVVLVSTVQLWWVFDSVGRWLG